MIVPARTNNLNNPSDSLLTDNASDCHSKRRIGPPRPTRIRKKPLTSFPQSHISHSSGPDPWGLAKFLYPTGAQPDVTRPSQHSPAWPASRSSCPDYVYKLILLVARLSVRVDWSTGGVEEYSGRGTRQQFGGWGRLCLRPLRCCCGGRAGEFGPMDSGKVGEVVRLLSRYFSTWQST